MLHSIGRKGKVVLDKQSRKLTVINAAKGLFEFERLPYGVRSSPSIFQRITEQLVLNIPMIVVYLDYVLVTLKRHKIIITILVSKNAGYTWEG